MTEKAVKEVDVSCTDLQYEAITSDLHTKPNSLLNIIAGPGSGKTRTLCNRIAYLLSNGSLIDIKPEEILVLSMTNRSVNDLRARLKKVLGDEGLINQLQVMTFHSFAGNIINQKYNDWQILEDEEIKRLNELIPNGKKSTYTVKTFKEIIKKSKFVTDLKGYENSELFKSYGFERESLIRLQELMGSHSMFTYEDILVECNEILSENPPDFISSYKAIIVDEFQDVYPILADIIIKLAKDKHLTIAGDPNQSIYGFLGATVSKNWGKVYPIYKQENKKTIVLSHSFRSTPELLALSSKVLGKSLTNLHNSVKSSKLLQPVRVSFNSQQEEYDFIYNEVKNLTEISCGQIKPSDIAVLSYSNKEIDSVYNYFKERGGFRLNRLNSTPRWLKTQLSFIVQYIKILIDPRQNFPLLSSLSLLHGVGLTSLNLIYLNAIKKDLSIWDYLTDPNITKPKKIEKDTKEFLSYLENARSTLNANDPNSIMSTLLNMGSKFGLKKRIHTIKLSALQADEYENYLRSIHKSLVKTLRFKPDDQTLLKYYLNNYNSDLLLNPNTNITKLYDDKEINFSTIHTSKGLEFPVVFILAANNFNLAQSYERKKVMYVGMTRASSLLYFNKLDTQFVSHLDTGIHKQSDLSPPISPTFTSNTPRSNSDSSDLSTNGSVGVFNSEPPSMFRFPTLIRLLDDMGRDSSSLLANTKHIEHLKMMGNLARKVSHH